MPVFRTLKLYQNWWKTWRTLPVISWIRAAQCFKAGKFEKAIELYRHGMTHNPLHPARVCARLDLAYCLFRIGRVDEAESELRIAVSVAPHLRDAHLRLAQVQLWSGHSLEAAWTLRRAVKAIKPDVEMAALFVLAVADGTAPQQLVRNAVEVFTSLELSEELHERAKHRYELAAAALMILKGEHAEGKKELARLAAQTRTSIEAILAYSEILLKEGKISFARQQLRRGMLIAPQHPRVLSLLAESYLRSGLWYDPNYAIQLAGQACRYSGWTSPREMHVLAEAYYHTGDRMAALVAASKAKEVGSRIVGSYHNAQSLDRLIDDLSTGTLG